MTADVPVPQATDYSELPGGIPQVPWATLSPLKRLGGVDQPVTNEGYGVDFLVQPLSVSPDWDLMAVSGSVGGGGSAVLGLDVDGVTFGAEITSGIMNSGGDFVLEPAIFDTNGNYRVSGTLYLTTVGGGNPMTCDLIYKGVGGTPLQTVVANCRKQGAIIVFSGAGVMTSSGEPVESIELQAAGVNLAGAGGTVLTKHRI